MPRIPRLVSLLAASAVLFTFTAVSACKDDGASPPAPAGDGTPPVTQPENPPAPVAGDAPVVETPAPVDPGVGGAVVCTADTRKGGMCTREYRPVCGTLADNTSKTFSNKCVACSDEKVARYVDGPCPGEPPA